MNDHDEVEHVMAVYRRLRAAVTTGPDYIYLETNGSNAIHLFTAAERIAAREDESAARSAARLESREPR